MYVPRGFRKFTEKNSEIFQTQMETTFVPLSVSYFLKGKEKLANKRGKETTRAKKKRMENREEMTREKKQKSMSHVGSENLRKNSSTFKTNRNNFCSSLGVLLPQGERGVGK
jgi:hypothetical protein